MTTDNPYRALPSVDKLLSHDRIRPLIAGHDAKIITVITRRAIESARAAITEGAPAPTDDQIAEAVLGLARAVFQPSLRPLINATGVIIHTNLGRAPLSDDAIRAMHAVSAGYSNLEFDLDAGERGSRFTHVEALLREVTGAEAAIAVNNNASAVYLVLTALARRREVIVSRGQAVEIGGGFRIPDVMRQSGARLVEVGTTNRTYLRDYENAITPATAAVMRVHSSNFRVIGFTESPSIQDMARVAHEHGLLLIDDLGSGCLLDTTEFGLAPEPTVQESIGAGTDLALFSGDKLLGGPQSGIIAGRSHLVDLLRRHPLSRALRMDKASIAGLAATLLHYLRGEVIEKVPVWQMISAPLDEIDRRAQRWARAIGVRAAVIEGRSMVGGGSLPEESLPTRLVRITGASIPPTDLARRLRLGDPPAVARIEHDALILDPRTVLPSQDRLVIAAARASLSKA